MAKIQRVMNVVGSSKTGQKIKEIELLYMIHTVHGLIHNAVNNITEANRYGNDIFMGGEDGQLIRKLQECMELAREYSTNLETKILGIPQVDKIYIVDERSQFAPVEYHTEWEDGSISESKVIDNEM